MQVDNKQGSVCRDGQTFCSSCRLLASGLANKLLDDGSASGQFEVRRPVTQGSD